MKENESRGGTAVMVTDDFGVRSEKLKEALKRHPDAVAVAFVHRNLYRTQ